MTGETAKLNLTLSLDQRVLDLGDRFGRVEALPQALAQFVFGVAADEVERVH